MITIYLGMIEIINQMLIKLSNIFKIIKENIIHANIKKMAKYHNVLYANKNLKNKKMINQIKLI